ncbi:MAG: response regulator [Acidobacteriota bacterium]|nr:response regulator [Acidobacteriota bacterium]MDE3171385.1 response regulator [Acidobacteriota bacterium]
MTPAKDVRVLVVDDNALILDLLMKGLAPHCDVRAAADGADALVKILDDPPDLILCDYRMPGFDGRHLYEKIRARQQSRHIPLIFLASRSDIEERLRPLSEGVEEFIAKPFFLKDLVRRTKKVIDRLHLEKLQNRAVRPGVIQGRLEEMSILDLMQSLEMGQKSCRLTVRHNGDVCELFFSSGQCADAKLGAAEGEEAVYQVVRWPAGEFEIDFNSAPGRATISRTTTGLLMEALRLMDEGQRDNATEGVEAKG